MGVINIKEDVTFKCFTRQTIRILSAILTVFDDIEANAMITCGGDSHYEDDPHPNGHALDIRTKHLQAHYKEYVRKALISELGHGYTVILEDKGGVNEHIHIQTRKDLWRVAAGVD